MLIGKFRDAADLFWACYRRIYIKLNWLPWLVLPRVKSPQVVEIELTNACNMGCPHCHRGLDGRALGYMSPKIFKKLVDELKCQPFAMLRFVGLGEPALHPQLPELMSYLAQSNIKVEFTTNGELLRRYSPEQICNWPIDILGISIDGTDADSYTKLRPGGDIDSLLGFIQQFEQYRRSCSKSVPVVKIRNVVVPGTQIDKIAEFKEFWLRYSDAVTFNTYNPKNGRGEPGTLRRCESLFFLAHVRWNGKVPLCCYQFLYSEQEYIGNLHHSTLREIWSSKRLAEVRLRHKRQEFERVSFCKRCVNTQCRKQIIANAKAFNASSGRLSNLMQKMFNII